MRICGTDPFTLADVRTSRAGHVGKPAASVKFGFSQLTRKFRVVGPLPPLIGALHSPIQKLLFDLCPGTNLFESRVIECQQPLGLLSLCRLQVGVPCLKQRFQFWVHLETPAARWRRPRSLSSGPESSPTTSQAGAACRPLPSRTAAAENPGR